MTMYFKLVNMSNWDGERIIVNVDGEDQVLNPGDDIDIGLYIPSIKNIMVSAHPVDTPTPFRDEDGNQLVPVADIEIK